jgi:hypothetical protein
MTDFAYDVFLSYNRADRAVARRIAEAMRASEMQVWFDEWVIKPGDDIYLAIERGLETSRVQVLFLSPAALGSYWVNLERETVPFRDPANLERRFIPALLSDCELPDSLLRFKYIDFRQDTEVALKELIDACRVARSKAPVDYEKIHRYLTAKVVVVGETGVVKPVCAGH